MAAPTRAICKGLASTLCCPIAENATAGGLFRDDAGIWPSEKGTSSGTCWLKPNFSACARSLSAPSRRPISPKTTLHETSRAWASVSRGMPPRQCSPPKLESLCVVWGRVSCGGFGNVVVGFIPFWSAAEAVTSLNVDPGG